MKGPAQHAFSDEPVDGDGTQFLVEHSHPVAARALGPVEGQVGLGQQFLGFVLAVGRACDTDAYGAPELFTVEHEGFPGVFDYPVGQRSVPRP